VRTLRLLALVAGVLVVTAVVSPWCALGVARLTGRSWSFARVFDRVFEVLLVGGLVLAWRRLDLGDLRAIGLRRPGIGRDLARGLLLGGLGVAAGLGLAAATGALAPGLRFPPAKLVRKSLLGLAAALGVGIGEETLFRGVLLRRVAHDAGTVVAVVVTTGVYAAVHALRTGRVAGPVDAGSGFARLAGLFAPLATADALPRLVGLALFGLLLAVLRLRSGSLWTAIGVHATWVAAFRVGRLFFTLAPVPVWVVGTGWPPLVGGAAGWLAVAVSAALVPALVGRAPRAAA